MGFSNIWIAIRGGQREDVLKTLALTSTGQKTDEPCEPHSIQAGPLPSGWFLIGAAFYEDRFKSAKILSQLSQSHRVITCSFEEHCMESSATEWRNGAKVWAIHHDSNRGIAHLEVSGSPPPEFATIRDDRIARQRNKTGVDYIFDIPVELAASIVGYRYDKVYPGTELQFEIFE